MSDEGWRLVWQDDFSVNGCPNPDIWTQQLGAGGWGNKERQCYTDSLENAFVRDSELILRALGSRETGYTSARLTTFGHASWRYGRFEIEAKLPRGKGSWPAIWMLPDAIYAGKPWPLCGEIDVMEHVGWNQDQVHVSLHTEKYNHIIGTQMTHFERLQGVSDGYHQYAMEWDEQQIVFYFDERAAAVFRKADRDGDEAGWPFDKPFHLILNIAAGGFWGGEIDDATLPWEMRVRAVRVYERTSE